ncbi:DsbA family protein [Kitasatospora sp. NPDC096147]|uniref:DsbA family protein n=1 Tax=Kitasatospora sp. NPDC096147 TaxID=3364093 RepID=UPI003829906B
MTDAPLPRLEFWADLQCPDCRTALTDLRALREQYGEALTLELRHFPLEKNRHAYTAAQAAEEALAQGRGWEYTEALLERCEELAKAKSGEAFLVALAGELGLDAEEMDVALIDGRHTLVVDADQAEGKAIGVTGTPTYLIAGQRLDGGKSQDGLRERITAILDAATTTA